MNERGRLRAFALGAGALLWITWCFFSGAVVTLLVQAAAVLFQRQALLESSLLAVAIEIVLLGGTAFADFRAMARLDPPRWYWTLGPAGYLVSVGVFVVLTRVLGATVVIATPGAALQIAAVCAVTAAGAYLGSVSRAATAPRAVEFGEGAVPAPDGPINDSRD